MHTLQQSDKEKIQNKISWFHDRFSSNANAGKIQKIKKNFRDVVYYGDDQKDDDEFYRKRFFFFIHVRGNYRALFSSRICSGFVVMIWSS